MIQLSESKNDSRMSYYNMHNLKMKLAVRDSYSLLTI
jgi:hypothetical protein